LTRDFDGTIRTLKALKIDSLPNRRDGDMPEGKTGGEDREAYVEQVRLENRCETRAQAWDIARRKKHELFK
jgi:hypothetical protein